MTDKTVEQIVTGIVTRMEDETGTKTYQATFSTGRSGLSFGKMQHDVGGI